MLFTRTPHSPSTHPLLPAEQVTVHTPPRTVPLRLDSPSRRHRAGREPPPKPRPHPCKGCKGNPHNLPLTGPTRPPFPPYRAAACAQATHSAPRTANAAAPRCRAGASTLVCGRECVDILQRAAMPGRWQRCQALRLARHYRRRRCGRPVCAENPKVFTRVQVVSFEAYRLPLVTRPCSFSIWEPMSYSPCHP